RMVSTLTAGGILAVSWGSCALIWSTVSMTLAPGCLKTALTDVAHPDRRAVAVGEDDVVELVRLEELIIGGDREADFVGVDRALGRVGGGGDERAADLFQRYAGRCELGRIDLDADRGRRVAEDRDLRDAGHLRDLLGEEEIAVIVDRGHRHRLRAQRQ